MPETIAVIPRSPEEQPRAAQLAVKLGLPLARPGGQYRLLLRCSHTGLDLVKDNDPSLTGPVRVNFTSGAVSFRRRQHKRELLLRAVGIKSNIFPAVLDGTGGFGRDSFILAAAGCQVRIVEREPVLAALLDDGLQRAENYPETAAIVRRIQLTTGDAVPILETMQRKGQQVDVVYIDPMFPERQKSAKVKKETRILQMLAAVDSTPERLLKPALTIASQRVVVKRPRKAPWLTDLTPSHCHTGKTIRFDVYLTGLKG